MENRNSYTAVGIFFMICMVFFGIFMWWMTVKTDSNQSYRSYYIYTRELPNGLKEGAQVRFLGVPSGIVKSIGFENTEAIDISIELSVRSNLPIRKDSVAKVEVQGISGIAYINISRGSDEVFKEDEKAVIKMDKTLLDKIGSRAEAIAETTDITLHKINEILSEENIIKFSNTLTSLDNFTKNLGQSERFDKVDNILNTLDSMLKNIDDNKSEFSELLKNTNEFMKSANELSKSATKTSNLFSDTQKMVKERISRGEFNVREILAPTLTEATKALIEFNKSLQEFKNALFRLEDNPYDFFFRERQTNRESE